MNKQLSHHPHKAALPLDWIAHALPSASSNIQRIETIKQRPWSQVYRIQPEGGVGGRYAETLVSLNYSFWLIDD